MIPHTVTTSYPSIPSFWKGRHTWYRRSCHRQSEVEYVKIGYSSHYYQRKYPFVNPPNFLLLESDNQPFWDDGWCTSLHFVDNHKLANLPLYYEFGWMDCLGAPSVMEEIYWCLPLCSSSSSLHVSFHFPLATVAIIFLGDCLFFWDSSLPLLPSSVYSYIFPFLIRSSITDIGFSSSWFPPSANPFSS